MLCIDDVYGGTQRYFRKIVSPSMGVEIKFVDMSKDIPFESNSRLLWLETPTNPTLKITDITKVSKEARDKNCLVAVDNTFCSPYFQVSLPVHIIKGRMYLLETLLRKLLSLIFFIVYANH